MPRMFKEQHSSPCGEGTVSKDGVGGEIRESKGQVYAYIGFSKAF